MTIITRLTLFSLVTLGLVLAGFSVALYALADDYLRRDRDHRLLHTADTLAAAIEIEPEGGARGLEWERTGRFLPVGGDYVWVATAGNGQLLDTSGHPGAVELAAAARRADEAGRSHVPFRFEAEGRSWRGVHTEYENGPPAPGRHAEIAITAAVPLDRVERTLVRLAGTLAGLSVAVWLLAAVAGRAVCRRALRPLTRMAEAAREMSADDPGVRLPVGPAADEPGELGRAFNGLLDRLGEAHERQRRFTAEASHQLRTPLAAMLGQVEVALRRDRPADEYRQALEAVRGQAGRLRQVTDALLFLARSDADASPPAREQVDLGAWLRTHLTVWADHPRAADLKLIPEADGPETVAVHPVMLGELVNNLIDNALKYSPPGTPVMVRFGNGGVSVEDLGCGIDPADRAHLFRPFYRSTAARRLGVPGLGLGLAIAGRLAAALGATVDVSSEVGKGSRFTVRLQDSV